MILGFTGHRRIENYEKLYPAIVGKLKELNPKHTISGMAIGADMLFAVICIRLSIPFIAAVPFKEQESKWPEQIQKQYYKLLNKAKNVVIVSEGEYDPKKFQIRNEWIVDNSDEMLAYWNGKQSGTGNCIRYALEISRKVTNIY